MHPDVKNYLNGLKIWKDELSLLRAIICECNLQEAFKWMHPCYTYCGKNIVLIHDFKDYCALLFNKGALLKDSKNLLVQQSKNVQSARQMRFTKIAEIEDLKDTIKEYINEAITIETTGKTLKRKTVSDFNIPTELQEKFKKYPNFDKAFKNLTPGRQKGYLLYFSQPKKSASKIYRIEKNMERIKDGYGLRDCVCGLSKRKPNCDGSHKQLGTA